MKTTPLPRIARVLGAVVVVASTSAAAQSLITPPRAERTDRIDRVVVFADRAEVTRTAPARCVDGTAAVAFPNLPDAIDPRTLRGEADNGAEAVGVSTTRSAELSVEEKSALGFVADASLLRGGRGDLPADRVLNLDEAVAALQKEIVEVSDQLDGLRRAANDDEQRAATMRSYGPWARTVMAEDLRQAKPDLARWDELLTLLHDEAIATSTTNVRRNAELRTLSRKLERLQHRLARLSPSMMASSVVATVAVQCGSSSSTTVRLSYVVPGARWNPEYDLRFTGPADRKVGAGTAALTVAGVVTQSSGEDWNDVEVWLSTAKPRLGGEAPLPNPIQVNGALEEKQKQLVQAQEVRADDLKAGGRSGASAAGAGLEDGGKAFVLKLPKRVTVHADGRPYWFPVDELTAPAKSSLVALPNLSPWVFQAVALNNPAAWPLMEGTVHVFRGATFVGNAALEYRAPGEPIELSLGIDEEVALERVDLMDQKREAGLFSGSQSIVQAFRTILHNRSASDVVVEVREQVPVTKTTDITVTIDAKKTAPGYALDALRGHVKWQVSMKKGQTEQRDIAFTIALPKEWAVQ
jgi:uncharacterized protein (TIGR02231 family)